jgi:hypothetical protein
MFLASTRNGDLTEGGACRADGHGVKGDEATLSNFEQDQMLLPPHTRRADYTPRQTEHRARLKGLVMTG